MPLPALPLDPRGYREVLAEALARIPVHNPEWTHFGEADPGVTLLQVFSFLNESLIYRLNLIPDRNRLKFLDLLGIPLQPAAAAQGVVTIVNERGPLETPTLQPGVPLAAGETRFVTRNGLDVLPIEAQLFVRRPLTAAEEAVARQTYEQLYGALEEPDTELQFYETTRVDVETRAGTPRPIDLREGAADNALWIALLVRVGDEPLAAQVKERIGGRTLTLGLMPWLAEQSRMLPPGGATPAEPPPPLAMDLSTRSYTASGAPAYLPLDAHADGNPFEELTLIQVTLPPASRIETWTDLDPLEEGVGDQPPALEDDEIRGRLLAWMRIRVAPNPAGVATSGAWNARFQWAGINAARVTQRVDVPTETLGVGNGEPDQGVTLVNAPVIAETVRVAVNGEVWRRIDDLFSAPPEVVTSTVAGAPSTDRGRSPSSDDAKVFTVDRESGEIRFGDGIHGMRPPLDASIVASYAYGGGRAGNVGAGAINTSPRLPAGFTVSNPLPTWGGNEGQGVADAERDIPRQFRQRDRAVSKEDFRDIVRRTPGVAVGRVDVLPLYDESTGTAMPGVVTLMLIPADPSAGDSPVPDRLFLEAVCRHLEPRRLLTTEVQLHGPEYEDLTIAIGFDIVAGHDVAVVREAVQRAIRRFLSPLEGGHEEDGWPLERTVDVREIWVRAARESGVASIRDVRMWNAAGLEVERIELTGLQLPRIARLSVRFGEAEDVGTMPPPPPKKRVPVPVVPRSC